MGPPPSKTPAPLPEYDSSSTLRACRFPTCHPRAELAWEWHGGRCTLLLRFGPQAQTGPGAVPHPALHTTEAMSANEPAAKEWLPAAAQAQPGVRGLRRADGWAGRAPLVKGNNVVQQGNRPFLAGRRDLISDHTGGQGRTPRSGGGAQRQRRCTICSRYQWDHAPGLEK